MFKRVLIVWAAWELSQMALGAFIAAHFVAEPFQQAVDVWAELFHRFT